MKYLLWDFENTLGYRQGMWSGTLHSILESNGIQNIKLEDIRPFLNIGFTWHSPDTPHSIFLNGKTWWEYMNEYFVEVYEKDRIELYTEPYATAFRNDNVESVFQDYQKATQKAQEIGLEVNAGHDLNLQNLEKFCSISGILEVSIGHALIADALEVGLFTAVQEYLKILSLN
ncbi:pyridoxine 5'-phosphate synthase [Nostoc sp.]